MKLVNAVSSKPRVWFTLALCVVYLGLFLYLDGLQFTPTWDEPRFWQTALQFSQSLIPSFEQLKNYGELNTPLPFIIFGAIEHLFKSGIFGGRLLNFVLSFFMVFLIGTSNPRSSKTSILAAVGLLIFPYYLLLSSYFYTDIIAAFFAFSGIWFYTREQHLLVSLAFILAIASRQYTIAFPAAVIVHELITSLKNEGFKIRFQWLAPLIALSSIFGWIVLFGGLAPSTAFTNAELPVPSVQKQLLSLDLSSSLYFLACLGAYFVIPEWILFNRTANWHSLLNKKNYALAFTLLVLLSIFPVLQAHGLLIKVVSLMPVLVLQMIIIYIPALLASIRFAQLNLSFWLVLMNAGIMLKAYPWDKYLMPLLLVLWYLRSAAPEQVGVVTEQATDRPSDLPHTPVRSKS